MKTHRSQASSRNHLAAAQWVSLTLLMLLVLPGAGFATLRRTVRQAQRESKLSVTHGRLPYAGSVSVPQAGILYFVDSTGDGGNVGSSSFCDDGTGHCTLRAAIQAANGHPGADGISIELPAGSVINLTHALPDLTESVSISGPGSNLVTVRRDTGGNYRIFNISTTGPVTFSGLTISNGAAASGNFRGGGINKGGGTLNVINCTLSGNIARRGGAISSTGGTVNVTNSILSGNAAGDSGGGISNQFGTLNVTNTTLNGNHADEFGVGNGTCGGGGIANGDGTLFLLGVLNVTNSTLSRNTSFHGGGICSVAGSITNVTNSTLSENHAFFSSFGGGIFSDSLGPVNVRATIIGLSLGALGRDVSGAFISGGFNLIGKIDGSTGFTAATDQTGTIASPLDPKLDPNGLQNNGGPTQTVALLDGSPAIDKGTSVGLTGSLTTDQRGTGFPRTVDDPAIPPATAGDNTDIGAFEFQHSPAPITAGPAVLINESCPPANGAIDPGERVTVYLNLTNNGSASTSNLVATLQSSGGVVAPSGPQSYGVIASGSTGGRDFSFTVNPSLICGGTLTATLQLQDGTNNLGTVTYNFTLGVNNGGSFVCTTPCGGVRLLVKSSLSRTSSTTVQANITIQNIGTLQADNTMMTTATLGANSGAPLPQALGNIAPGSSASVVVNFNNSMGGASTLAVGGTYSGGTFSSTRRVTVP